MKFFCSNFKVEWENSFWAKILFLASGSFVHKRQFQIEFYIVFQFLDLSFISSFPNPFIVRSRSSCLFSQWKFFELYVRTCPALFLFLYDVFTLSFMTLSIQNGLNRKTQRASSFIRGGPNPFLEVAKLVRVVKLLGMPYFKVKRPFLGVFRHKLCNFLAQNCVDEVFYKK